MPVRGYLNKHSVLAIFADRPLCGSGPAASNACHALARKYNVSNKTIRDIWNRKSWISLTAPFCSRPDTTTATPTCISPTNSDASSASPAPSSDFSAPFHQQAATLFDGSAAAHQDTHGLLDDIDRLACSRHPDPFCREWESAITDIDMQTMVAANDIVLKNNSYTTTDTSNKIEPSINVQWHTFAHAEAPSAQESAWIVENCASNPPPLVGTDLQATPLPEQEHFGVCCSIEVCGADRTRIARFEAWDSAMAEETAFMFCSENGEHCSSWPSDQWE